jgi:hypothetical protein
MRDTRRRYRRHPGVAGTVALVVASFGLVAACSQTGNNGIGVTVPLVYKDQLLYAAGSIDPTLRPPCTVAEAGEEPAGSGSERLLIDMGASITAFATAGAAGPLRPQPFGNGQVWLRSAEGSGITRFLLCDAPVVRTGEAAEHYVLSYAGRDTGPLGGVMGGDLLVRYSVGLRFRDGGADLLLGRSDIATSCQLDDAVLPFKAIGGELAVRVSDTVLTYPASRVTVGACVEPHADPLSGAAAKRTPCLTRDPARYADALGDILARRAALVPGSASYDSDLERLRSWEAVVKSLADPTMCRPELFPDLGAAIGDVVDAYRLHEPPYRATDSESEDRRERGVDMRFAISTAVPELILSQSACRRLLGGEARCGGCPGQEVELALPGLNPIAPDAGGVLKLMSERGCRLKLGGPDRAAMVLVAKQRYLSPCGELQRSRRQRYALPQQDGRRTPENDCQAEACLVNSLRDTQNADRRCGYTGPDADLACDDHRAPVAATVEIGGPGDEYAGPPALPDTLDALVVPDSAPVLQAANADVRDSSPRIDGILGVAVLARLTSTIDYPQGRLVLSCRCERGHTCRAYPSPPPTPAPSAADPQYSGAAPQVQLKGPRTWLARSAWRAW